MPSFVSSSISKFKFLERTLWQMHLWRNIITHFLGNFEIYNGGISLMSIFRTYNTNFSAAFMAFEDQHINEKNRQILFQRLSHHLSGQAYTYAMGRVAFQQICIWNLKIAWSCHLKRLLGVSFPRKKERHLNVRVFPQLPPMLAYGIFKNLKT